MPTNATGFTNLTSSGAPISIAFCITELDPGGAERALVQLVTRLDRSRWEPVVYCLAGVTELAAELEQQGIPVVCLGARGIGSLGVIPALAKRLRVQQPAILQTYLYHANIVGRIAGRWAGVPHIVSGLRVAERRSRFRLWLDRRTEKYVEKHVCVSRAVAQFSVETGKLNKSKVLVIPNGVDAERFAHAEAVDLTQYGIPTGAPVLLFVGRLDEQKSPFDLLKAFAHLSERHADSHLLVVGDGPLRDDMEHFISSHEIEQRAHLIGRQNDIPGLMQSATCLVLPSLWEGMPNVILEAMAARLPVIATEVEGTTELLKGGGESGDFGILLPPSDPNRLAESIENLLLDAKTSQQMAEAAQHYATEHLTWQKAARDYAQLYEELLKNSAR